MLLGGGGGVRALDRSGTYLGVGVKMTNERCCERALILRSMLLCMYVEISIDGKNLKFHVNKCTLLFDAKNDVLSYIN